MLGWVFHGTISIEIYGNYSICDAIIMADGQPTWDIGTNVQTWQHLPESDDCVMAFVQ